MSQNDIFFAFVAYYIVRVFLETDQAIVILLANNGLRLTFEKSFYKIEIWTLKEPFDTWDWSVNIDVYAAKIEIYWKIF